MVGSGAIAHFKERSLACRLCFRFTGCVTKFSMMRKINSKLPAALLLGDSLAGKKKKKSFGR